MTFAIAQQGQGSRLSSSCCFSQSLASCPAWSEHTVIFSTALKSRPCSQSNYHINGSYRLLHASCTTSDPAKQVLAFTPISQLKELKRRGRVICSGSHRREVERRSVFCCADPSCLGSAFHRLSSHLLAQLPRGLSASASETQF